MIYPRVRDTAHNIAISHRTYTPKAYSGAQCRTMGGYDADIDIDDLFGLAHVTVNESENISAAAL